MKISQCKLRLFKLPGFVQIINNSKLAIVVMLLFSKKNMIKPLQIADFGNSREAQEK